MTAPQTGKQLFVAGHCILRQPPTKPNTRASAAAVVRGSITQRSRRTMPRMFASSLKSFKSVAELEEYLNHET